jgi:hypothetical protein
VISVSYSYMVRRIFSSVSHRQAGSASSLMIDLADETAPLSDKTLAFVRHAASCSTPAEESPPQRRV